MEDQTNINKHNVDGQVTGDESGGILDMMVRVMLFNSFGF